MGSVEKTRVCSSCHRSDRTSFSKCRFCGTGYDANQSDASTQKNLLVTWCSMIILFGAGYCIFVTINVVRANQLTPVTPVADQVRRPNVSSKSVSPAAKLIKSRKLATN
jgi:hypothetical protein